MKRILLMIVVGFWPLIVLAQQDPNPDPPSSLDGWLPLNNEEDAPPPPVVLPPDTPKKFEPPPQESFPPPKPDRQLEQVWGLDKKPS